MQDSDDMCFDCARRRCIAVLSLKSSIMWWESVPVLTVAFTAAVLFTGARVRCCLLSLLLIISLALEISYGNAFFVFVFGVGSVLSAFIC